MRKISIPAMPRNHLALLVLLALVALAAIELTEAPPFAIKGPFALAWHIHTHPVSSWMLGTLLLLLALVSGRLIFSIVVTVMCAGVIVIASHVKIGHLGTPLTLADVHFFARNISENIVLFKAYPALGLMSAGALATVIAGGLFLWRIERAHGTKGRMLSAFALFSLSGCAWYLNGSSYNGAIPKPAIFKEDIAIGNGFTHLQRLKATGESSFGDLLEIFASDASTDPILPAYVANNRFKPTQHSSAGSTRPDVFAILEESTFDPKLLSSCDGRSECESLLFQPSPAPQQSGLLFVHSGGGGTWLSEFAFLTGFDWRSFGPAGAHAPTTLAQRSTVSLPRHLQQLGYQTIAIYPVTGNFLNARKAYKSYGFEHFIAAEELGITTDWKHTTDKELFERALSAIENVRDGRPIFIFLLTIRNHAPHATSLDELPKGIPTSMRDLDAPLVDYLLRLRESEEALNDLKKRWLDSSKTPRVLAWFGDHQPVFAMHSELSERYLQQRFQDGRPAPEHLHNLTWYALHSNRPPSEHQTNRNKILDLAYLGTELLKFSGLPDQANTTATQQIQATCPIGIVVCKDDQAVKEYLSFRIWDLHEIQPVLTQ